MLEEINIHLRKDKILAPLVIEYDLPQIEVKNDLFTDLVETIISQQLSLKAAATILSRFYDFFDNQKLITQEIIDAEHDDLRSVGLSNQKAKYVKNVASYFQEKRVKNIKWSDLSDQKITEELTSIKGVGVWTSHMILMFHFKRPDVFPLGDLIVKNKIIELYKVQSAGKELVRDLEKIGENWKPFRSYASRYLWAYNNA